MLKTPEILKNLIWQQKMVIGGKKLITHFSQNKQIKLQKLSKYGERESVENVWFGCEHSDCEIQGKLILEKLQEQKPQVIILEGMKFWTDAALDRKLEYLLEFKNLSLAECLTKHNSREKGAIYFYLCQNLEKVKNKEIQIICGEGSLQMEIVELTKKYDKSDILEMYLVREIMMYFRKVKIENDFNLTDLLNFVGKFVRITGILELLNLERMEKFTLENNFKIYLEKLEQKYRITLQNFDPKTSRKLEYLMIPQENSQIKIRRIKKTLSNLRDYFLQQKLKNTVKNSDGNLKTFVLYGSSHIENIWSNSRNK